jgi:poly(3-hydroxybutyrate) depolymerase
MAAGGICKEASDGVMQKSFSCLQPDFLFAKLWQPIPPMKSKIIMSFLAAALLAANVAGADAPTAPNPPPADQPAAFQSEALPPAGQANAAPRGGRAAMGAVTHSFTADELVQLHAKLDELNAAIKSLKDAKADDDLIVDAESCGWIVETALRVPNTFGGDNDAQANPFNKCISSLNAGLRRAQQIKDGTAEWPKIKGSVKRAYRSVVDGTAQPYTLSIPASYDPAKPTPLYIYLHGMSHYVPDLGWDWTGGADRPGGAGGAGGGRNYIRLECFGRGNNSFRWAGETDVLEALASVEQRYNIDTNRIVLAGFSMGGAGSWQIGLHQPDLFCGLEIDAGVIGSLLNLDGNTPAQKASRATYGIMIPHALNATAVPLVGYAGANDAQLASSKNISAQLVRDGYHMEVISPVHSAGTDINTLWLANPGQGHSHATGETAQMINAFTSANFQRGRVVPDQIHFVTYTTRYNHDFWITVDGMQQSFDQARVDAARDAEKSNFTITTTNISRLVLDDAAAARKISIDGEVLDVKAGALQRLLVRAGGHWRLGNAAAPKGLRKQHDLQGPVNDAFFDSFLCVTPSGKAFNAVADQRAKQELARFTTSFARDYCGDARAKADTEITDADIADNNLILFGDPGSNHLLARVLKRLPLKWTKDSITLAGKTYTAADHMPVMIYPNPLNPKRYVVINAGLSAPRGGDAFGDYAILKGSTDDTGKPLFASVEDGVFDESWQPLAVK